ncbi:endoglucanase 6-like [Populus alba]|uniref:endoglucanase 6-like n=1 Tax=Populus alba TaxID=43335 RepID=UPI003CC732F6
MAFTVTVLAWSTVEFQSQLEAKNELSNAMDAIKRGTDYFIKAHPQPDVLYGEDGDAEAAAAFAAASVAFKPSNPTYICN